MTKQPKTLLIDGDILVYKAASAVQQAVDWGGGLWSVWGYEQEAIPKIKEALAAWQARLDADKVVVCLSCPTHHYWRHVLEPSYKQNRSNTVRPVLLSPMRKYVEENYECKIKPNMEADDVLGIMATHPKIIPGKKIIVSEDKDMKSIPGRLYNPRTDVLSVNSVTQADMWHLYQTLIGDSTDGYKGCPGIGPKRAEKIDNWAKAFEQFRKAGCEYDYALTQARLARICRADDYDFEKGEVILWEPPIQAQW